MYHRLTANKTSLLYGFLGGKNITFKEKDRVSVVAGSTNYKGKHSGRIGTVMYVYENNSTGNIAVLLDNVWNDSSGKGWFYFKESDLRIFYELKIDNLQATPQTYLYSEIGICSLGAAPLLGIDATATKITTKMNGNGENKNMKSEKIVGLWKKAGMESVDAEAEKSRRGIITLDPNYIQLQKYVVEIDRIIKESGEDECRLSGALDCERFVNNATRQRLAEIRDEMNAKKKNLSCLVDEIAAMLSACDTYEQEMDVLRTYNVIDEDRRLNKIFHL